MSLEELQKEIKSWSRGFTLEGKTKEELQNSLESIENTLTNEISDQARRYDKMIDELNLPEV